MSLGELLVVILVAIIVTRPGDIPIIITKIQQLKLYFSGIQNKIRSYITQDIGMDNSMLENSPEQLNFYLERIINMQGYYEGDYSLNNLKAKHNELIKLKRINSLKPDQL
ncbi:DUF2672 domain-containing protein [Candidatus Tisiphia endosymbiont of Nemotelus uliginosus]|uniref:DUF2672 domain-containing protein n=1 Tax=Candidatus Tisiphia endosymbiont of Nemotelus uliginosus TaxID=3077926 RepID=UPI0035C916CA